MMIEKSGSIELRDISIEELAPEVREMVPEIKEMAAGMVRVKHLYRSALKIAVTQMEILDEEFAGLYDHSPIHHIEHRIKTLESAAKKLKRRGYDLTIDNIYAHIQDMARTEAFRVIREADYIKEPKETGYRSLHLIVEVPIVISEGTLKLPVEIQLRTIAMDMWASLEHELRYKSDRHWGPAESNRLRLCSDAIYEVDREMQNIYQGKPPEYED